MSLRGYLVLMMLVLYHVLTLAGLFGHQLKSLKIGEWLNTGTLPTRLLTSNTTSSGLRGAVSPDHIHMLLSAPPHLAPAKLVQYIKGRSSRKLQEEFPELRKGSSPPERRRD